MKKAFTKLDELGVSYDFHDYKKQGIEKETIQRWVDTLGIDKVLNKRGTTWRKLSDEQKKAADTTVDSAIDLLVANTSMIKRPVIEGVLEANQQDQPILLCGFDDTRFTQTLQ